MDRFDADLAINRHPAEDLMDEDEDDVPPPPVPKLNQRIVNGA